MIQDWGTAIFNALANAVNLILTFIPRLIGFLVILIANDDEACTILEV